MPARVKQDLLQLAFDQMSNQAEHVSNWDSRCQSDVLASTLCHTDVPQQPEADDGTKPQRQDIQAWYQEQGSPGGQQASLAFTDVNIRCTKYADPFIVQTLRLL